MERKLLTIAKWVEEAGLNNPEAVAQIYSLAEQMQIIDDEESVVAYIVGPDFKGKKVISELFFYIKPEARSIKKLNNMLEKLEERCIIEGCEEVKVGSNFGYKDDMFVKYLYRKGYKTDSLRKKIRGK